MEHIKYSNLVKAILHCHMTVHSFYSDISVIYERTMELIQIQLFVDRYETHLDIFTGEGTKKMNLIKLRIVNFHVLNNITWEESVTKHNSYVNITPRGEFDVINYIELNPEVIQLYRRVMDKEVIDRDCIDEQHFQFSTVKDIGPIEDYHYMSGMYDHYHEFVPQGKGVMVRYNTDQNFCTDEFRDFVAKKVWGLIALA